MNMKNNHKVKVNVSSYFLEEHSDPVENTYLWAYKVKIRNIGLKTVTLISRHWKIIDANGFQKEVIGDGVVGEQPVLKPGESFEYTSGTPLNTTSGLMHGSYHMKYEDGSRFEVQIPAFSLDIPNQEKNYN